MAQKANRGKALIAWLFAAKGLSRKPSEGAQSHALRLALAALGKERSALRWLRRANDRRRRDCARQRAAVRALMTLAGAWQIASLGEKMGFAMPEKLGALAARELARQTLGERREALFWMRMRSEAADAPLWAWTKLQGQAWREEAKISAERLRRALGAKTCAVSKKALSL